MEQKVFPLKEISIEDLFFSPEKSIYEIPIYQRNYAWEKDEITALINDVYDAFENKDNSYYIGTLVSYSKGDNVYEVIDGQQRLTTIRIILAALEKKNSLNKSITNSLTYRARKKSDITINNLPLFIKDENNEVDEGIEHGYKCAEVALDELGIANNDDFINFFLERVHIIHYKVPKDIDLNHYFEIMNSRGEQLEKHEIVKANLMEKLVTNEERKVFNIIWESCSNMSIYVQQSFAVIKVEKVFGNDLHSFGINDFDELVRIYQEEVESRRETEEKNDDTISISRIIYPNDGGKWAEINDDTEKKDSFQPIIDFPNFLLIVLKIMKMAEDGFLPDKFRLDDKELLSEFDNAKMDSGKVKNFAFKLLKARYFLDNYVVHHSKEDETKENNPWKLQVWHKGDSKSHLKNLADDDDVQNLLVQALSMFEVSFTARQRKNYLFYCLFYLMNNDVLDISKYCRFVEGLADKYFKRVYLEKEKLNEINTPKPGSFDESILKDNRFDDSYNPVRTVDDFKKVYGDGINERSKGVPLYVFNYLDYLLWKNYSIKLRGESKKAEDSERQTFFKELGCSDFGLDVFKQFYFSRTRRSLEHYYPQANATDKEGALNQTQINCIGNYAMIGSDANSSGSNWSPETKLKHYVDSSAKINPISVASLKFWIMMQMCKDNNGRWEANEIQTHQDNMLAILMQ